MTMLIRSTFCIICSFYVILNGSVSIFINNLIADAVEEDDGETVPDDTNLYNEKGELDRGKFGNHIVQIGKT